MTQTFSDAMWQWKKKMAEQEKVRHEQAKADFESAKAIAAKAGLLLLAPDEANDFYILRAARELRYYPPRHGGDLVATRWRLAIDVVNETLRPLPGGCPDCPRFRFPRGGRLADILHAAIERDDDAQRIFRAGYQVPEHLAAKPADQAASKKTRARPRGPQPAPATPEGGA